MREKGKYDLFEWIGQRKSRWLLHLLFWLAVLLFYTVFFGYQNVSYKITFSFVIVLLPVTIITTYFLNYELIPNYLLQKKYIKFFLYFVYTLIVSFYIEMVTVMGIFIAVAEMKMIELHPSNTNAIFLIAGMYMVVFLGVAIKLVNQYNSNQVEIQKLKSDKIETELKFLKAQLHPHFLFNTLNNLYSLTLDKSDKASDVVLKLSELLDYVLYKCNSEFVPLNDEVNQLENYIELEKLRYGDRLDVDFRLRNIHDRVSIPPMLLMTLLENCFKHGVSKTMDNSWIKVDLEFNEETTLFKIVNSKHLPVPKPEKSGGIGLKNLQSRLQLIYKDKFELKIEEDTSYFSVGLKLTNKIES
jgi:sensor histidine kinase YesM